ncbi:alpha/beta hydrolase [Actinoplanes sp. NPDC024001]|uniref:alpha/beta hydrolase n=1 Tax=Actinoplanes sp. NPDC024001 TaxID=3154598 RepID=UPI0033DC5445
MTGLLIFAAVVVALVLAAWLAFRLSPWPMVLVIRHLPALSGEGINERLQPAVPSGIVSVLDERYDPADRDAYLDVFRPDSATGPLPTIVWVHGGAFIAGTRKDLRNYLRILAGRGFTTVGVEYSHAPERRYPTPVLQVAAALAYLRRNAARLGVDPDRIVLAGDSAGAQIAGQIALALCDAAFAAAARLPLVAPGVRIRATVLACGPYDLNLPDYQGEYGRFLRAIMWAYTGTRDFQNDPRFAFASLPQHVSEHFPPTFLTVGNGDPLRRHSVALAEALRARGVTVDALFYPDDHSPILDHEYQIDLNTDAGAAALERIVAHVDTYTRDRRPAR